MITDMHKYAFMVFHKEYDQFLSTLRDLGVVHIQEKQSVGDHTELQDMLNERKRVTAVMRHFKRLNSENGKVELAPARDIDKNQGFKLIEEIERLEEQKMQMQAVKQSLEKDIDYMTLWGDFSYTNIMHLKKAGFDVTFFSCPTSRYEPSWGEKYNAVLINNFQSVTYFITLTKEGTVIEIDAERPKMPDMGFSKLQLRFEQLKKDIQALDEKMIHLAASEYNTLDLLDRHLQNEFNRANVVVQTDLQASDKLMLLEGWTTEEHVPALEAALDKDGYFYQQLEIQENDRVPIKLKNSHFSKLYEPITRMFSLPKYTEYDPTPFLAPFFMLFFGLCFGDGGYGLLILLGCTLLKRKVDPTYKPYLTLFQYLGGMTVVVGILTGSFFGVSLIEVPAFQSIKGYFLNSDNLMTLSIVIGIIHIIYGKTVAAFQTTTQKGLKYAIAKFGWVFVIAALAIAFGLPMLNVHLSQTVIYLCYGVAAIGFLVAIFYNSPGKNVFFNFGAGLWNTYNMASGLLGDTLSYIRLFAIGLTGSILGGVFNQLADTMTEGLPGVARFIGMLLILLIGHSINFALCMISSLVHPIRLIFVEYYKNAEFEGGGRDYVPFKKA
ncbi:V-type ATPase 116kDa subunit family protein [Parabacteroides sp. PF5-9]|uniref:V-type ATP synthase subunit I n=1 Tax=Parabacteroides sp. PF5-9 TaxID=1742404 RepID=UPI002473B592|nr:V-type ATPase 116kDa subunit family protein [Parabacteroides sp. PF5-9]MDH6357845.1 V/A-type H+-transporting ATPase subunit I [Parabacteroides sp. PF5-9]